MAEERATAGHPFWGCRWGILPRPGRRYLQWRYSQCRNLVAGKRILEVPSGEGLGLSYLSRAAQIVCLDYHLPAVATATTRGDQRRTVGGLCADMAKLPFKPGSFECVVSLEGLEHLDRDHGVQFLAGVHHALADDGLFLLSCPLCVEGRHSGNAYHRHEWTWADLKEVLQAGWSIERTCFSERLGHVVWCALRRRPASTMDSPRLLRTQANRGVAQAMAGVRQWMQLCWKDGGAGFEPQAEAALLPTCFAVLASECTGDLETYPDSLRSQTATQIASRQDPETGLFDPGPLNQRDLSAHSVTYLRLQATYFGIHALDALGATCRSSIRLVERLQDKSYLRGWLDGGPWSNPWLHSNNIMFALTFLEYDCRRNGTKASLDAFDETLLYLDERQDPATGLWQPDYGVNLENAVYAAYHFFPYYFWRGCCPRYVDVAIDSVLAIQKADGLFGPGIGGGACEDLDAVHTLAMLSLTTDYRAEDVRRALIRCFWRLLQIQNADGGFPNKVWHPLALSRKRRLARALRLEWLRPYQDERPKWFFSGWKRLGCDLGRSDMWSAWFRPLALKVIVDRYPDLADLPPTGRYRRLPGLGWHDTKAIQAARAESLPREAAPGQSVPR